MVDLGDSSWAVAASSRRSGVLVGIPILQLYCMQVVVLEETGFLLPLYIPCLGSLIIPSGATLTATCAGLGPAIYAVRERIPEAIAYE